MECSKNAVTQLHKDYINFIQGKDPIDWRDDKDFVELVSNLAIAMYNVGTEVIKTAQQ